MKISLIVPVYNSEKYLEKCLASIRRQSFKDFECLLIDDESTDSSLDICRKMSREDLRFQAISKSHSCAADARNAGLAIASGEYVQFVDSDDELLPDCLKNAIDFAESNQLDMTFFDGMILNAGSSVSQYSHDVFYMVRRKDYGIASGKEMLCRMVDARNINCFVFLQLIKRASILHSFKSLPLDEDLLYTVENMLEAKRAGHLHKKMYVKRSRPSSTLTSRIPFEMVDSLLSVKIELTQKLENCDQKTKQCLEGIMTYIDFDAGQRWNALTSEEKGKLENLSFERRKMFLSMIKCRC